MAAQQVLHMTNIISLFISGYENTNEWNKSPTQIGKNSFLTGKLWEKTSVNFERWNLEYQLILIHILNVYASWGLGIVYAFPRFTLPDHIFKLPGHRLDFKATRKTNFDEMQMHYNQASLQIKITSSLMSSTQKT